MSTDELVLAIAGSGLPGATAPLPTSPLADEPWRALLRAVASRRIGGHALRAAEDGALPVTEQQFIDLCGVHAQAMGCVLRIEHSLLDVVGRLDAQGIDHRVLKGAALAHTCYDEPWERVYGDVDLLVPSASVDRAVDLIEGAGYHRVFPQLRDGFDRRFGKAVTLEAEDGLQIDLHRTFLMGPYGLLVATEALFDDVQIFEVGGRSCKALNLEAQVLHGAYTVALGDVPAKPTALRDLAQLLLCHPVDPDGVLALADASSACAVLARGITLTWEALQLADVLPLTVWAHRYRPTRREVRLMRSYTGTRRSYAAKSLDAVWVLPTMGDRLAYLHAVGVPRRSLLEHQGASGLSWLRRGSRRMVAPGRHP